jgi:hypothetical protein
MLCVLRAPAIHRASRRRDDRAGVDRSLPVKDPKLCVGRRAAARAVIAAVNIQYRIVDASRLCLKSTALSGGIPLTIESEPISRACSSSCAAASPIHWPLPRPIVDDQLRASVFLQDTNIRLSD